MANDKETHDLIVLKNGKQEVFPVEILYDNKVGAGVNFCDTYIHSSDINLLCHRLNKINDKIQKERDKFRNYIIPK